VVLLRSQRDPIHAVVVGALTDVLGLFEREPERFVHFLDSLVDRTKERLVPSCAKGRVILGRTHSILNFQWEDEENVRLATCRVARCAKP
jgi:hypothetical protein